MKHLIKLTILIVLSGNIAFAQTSAKKTRKQKRLEREKIRKENVKKQLQKKDFIFEATHANPLSGSTVYLNSSYDVKVKSDSVFSYLPFFGVAYRVEYGGRNSGFIFELPLSDYECKDTEKGYDIKFKAKNKLDLVEFHLSVSNLGYATLQINSTNRQSISYYGEITRRDE